MKITHILSSLLLLPVSALIADSPQGLRESTIIEVINDVEVLSGADLDPTPAVQGELFKAPDFLETGRRSKARLEAADGTITRVGSNTLFSFQETDRTINLERGSLLFHSPEGNGGGRIVTASATASVVGTTIIVEATADGGFNLFVLEGVARITYPDDTTRDLEAGQMTYVQPNPSGETEKGPVVDFDLEAFTEDSSLVNGFNTPLASLSLIKAAIADQNEKIEDGSLQRTGTFVLVSDENDVTDLDLNSLNDLFEAQMENDPLDFEPMVLVGAISASVEIEDVEFANLPSGKVLKITDSGVEILDPENTDPVPAYIPRVIAESVGDLPTKQKDGLARKLANAFGQILEAYDEGTVSAEDAIEIAKFLLSVDLPFDQRFLNEVEDRFGPLVDDSDDGEDESARVTDPLDFTDDPVQVTDPIDINDGYFTP